VICGIENFLTCISSNAETPNYVIRKPARLTNYYNSKRYVLSVPGNKEEGTGLGLAYTWLLMVYD